MTPDDYARFSNLIRRCSQIMQTVDRLAADDPPRAEEIARELKVTLCAAQKKLSKIQLPTPRASRWQGIKRPNQMYVANGRSDE